MEKASPRIHLLGEENRVGQDPLDLGLKRFVCLYQKGFDTSNNYHNKGLNDSVQQTHRTLRQQRKVADCWPKQAVFPPVRSNEVSCYSNEQASRLQTDPPGTQLSGASTNLRMLLKFPFRRNKLLMMLGLQGRRHRILHGSV
jgi:hypothetical protein